MKIKYLNLNKITIKMLKKTKSQDNILKQLATVCIFIIHIVPR